LHNQFLTPAKLKEAKEAGKTGVYLMDQNLKGNFAKDEYKLALFHYLVPYAIRYYAERFTSVDMSEYIAKWEEICTDNDNMTRFLEERCEITNDPGDKINRDDFLFEYQVHFQLKKITWGNIVNDIKRLDLTYNKDLRFGEDKCRGGLVGIKFIKVTPVEIYSDENEVVDI
jgi:hypothetical protein